MPTCVAIGCTNRTSRKKPGLSFHKFPKGPLVKNAWIVACRRKNWMPTYASRLCSLHFNADDFFHTKSGLTKLKKTAVPCIFEAIPSFLKEGKKQLKKQRKAIPIKEKATSLQDAFNYISEDSSGCELKAKFSDGSIMKFPDGSLSVVREYGLNLMYTQSLDLSSCHSSETQTKIVPSSPSSSSALCPDPLKKNDETLMAPEVHPTECSDDSIDDSVSTSNSYEFTLNPDSVLPEQEIVHSHEENYIKNIRSDFEIFVAALDKVIKPNELWTISHTFNYVICAKWDAECLYERHVSIAQDFSVKIFLKNRQISIPDISTSKDIHQTFSYLSMLLAKVDKLVICNDIEQRKSQCLGYVEEKDMTDEKFVLCEMCLIYRQKKLIHSNENVVPLKKESFKAAQDENQVIKPKSALKQKIKKKLKTNENLSPTNMQTFSSEEEQVNKNCIQN